MNGRARMLLIVFAIAPWAPAEGQVTYQPTPAPIVTADNETWYLAGEPVMHAGNIYYPAGPKIHFMPFEMVRSGSFKGMPLYTRTTLEPYSVVFVPLAGGLMQPYEQRRAGDLAGTVGSQAPSFPVSRGWVPPDDASAPVAAAAPPALTGSIGRGQAPEELATTGILPPARRATVPPRPSANGIFINFDGERWFSAGEAIVFDPTGMTQIGERNGSPVYQRKGAEGVIYIPVVRGSRGLVTPYVQR